MNATAVAHAIAGFVTHPASLWGLTVRLLGLVYVIAFASIHRDVVALAGRRGLSPIVDVLSAMRRDVPGWRRVVFAPTLLWLDARDATLRALCIAGMLAGVCVMAGLASPLALAVCAPHGRGGSASIGAAGIVHATAPVARSITYRSHGIE